MTQPISTTEEDRAPALTAASTAGRGGSVPAARAIARVFPLGDDDDRILLGVADGIGDPPSAEAQAAEALARLERTGGRAPQGTQATGVLEAAYAEAAEAIARLNALPGSVPGAGAAMTAAIVSQNSLTIAHLGRGAAFLRRGGQLRRLTADHRWGAATEQAVAGEIEDPEATQEFGTRAPLGAGGPVSPDITAPIPLQAGDTLLLCSEAVVRRLGAKVIAAVLDEYSGDEAAPELTDLAAQQEGVYGAAVSMLRLPSRAVPVLPAPATAAAAPLAAARGGRRLGPTLLVLIGAIVAGAAIAGSLYYAATRGDNKGKLPATAVAGLPLASPAAVPAAAIALSPSPRSALPATTAQAAGPGTSGARGTGTPGIGASVPGASPTPIIVANLPSCDSSQPPCRYRAQPGDSLSLIGDKFTVTSVCFAAANRTHQPVAPQPPGFRIGAGEDYAILTPTGCAAITPANPSPATPTLGVAPSPSSSPSARGACTPRPGASAANPLC